MVESFGARLRGRREELGIDLVAIASQTKIKQSLLEGLERDDVTHWPAGIFRRAYVRAYAQAIGLDPDVVLREFLSVHAEPEEVVTTEALAAAVDGGRGNGGPPTRLRYIMGSAIGSLARLRRSTHVEQHARQGSVQPAPVPSPAPDLPAFSPSVEPEPREASPAAGSIEREDADPWIVDRESDEVSPSRNIVASDPVLPPDAVAIASVLPSIPSAPPSSEGTERIVGALDRYPEKAHSQREEIAPPEPDLLAFARVCTELGRVEAIQDVQRLLGEAAAVLDAPGLVVWAWDSDAGALVPTLAYGYSEKVLAHLPALKPDADNATAAAFRTGRTCVIAGAPPVSGGIVIPLLTPGGCAGVLAIELRHGTERRGSVRAIATIVAAMLAQLVGGAAPAEAGVTDEFHADVAEGAPTMGRAGARG